MNANTRSTAYGVMALIFWGSTIAFSRSLAEKLGTLTAASYIFLLAGGLSCTYLIISREFGKLVHLPKAYLFGCGTLFIVYMASLYLAIGSATNRLQTLEVGLVNYLWPSLTLVMAAPILKKKARATLIPGCLLGFGGALLAAAQIGESWNQFVGNLITNWLSVRACLRGGRLLGIVLELDPPLGERGRDRGGAIVPSGNRIGTRGVAACLPRKNSME